MFIIRAILKFILWFFIVVLVLNVVGWILAKLGVLDRVVFDFVDDDEDKNKKKDETKKEA